MISKVLEYLSVQPIQKGNNKTIADPDTGSAHTIGMSDLAAPGFNANSIAGFHIATNKTYDTKDKNESFISS